MRVRICTYVFGKQIEWLKRTVTSLSWPLNRKALEGALWRIYTPDEERVRPVVEPLGLQVEFVKISQIEPGLQLTQCLIAEVEHSFENDAGLLTIQPDTIFGEGTIQTLLKLGHEGYHAISVAHPRVVQETFPDLKEPTSNAKLVGLAFKHLHPLWKYSCMEPRQSNCHNSGVAWRRIREDLYAVTVRIPTPYFVRPKRKDWDFLKSLGGGAWDHTWPQVLVNEQRHRLVGSSDAAFMVELTEGYRGSGLVVSTKHDERDFFVGDKEHHKVNRNSLVIWRAEQ